MGKQKKYAQRRLPKGFASWQEFAKHAAKKRTEKHQELKRLADIGRQAEEKDK